MRVIIKLFTDKTNKIKNVFIGIFVIFLFSVGSNLIYRFFDSNNTMFLIIFIILLISFISLMCIVLKSKQKNKIEIIKTIVGIILIFSITVEAVSQLAKNSRFAL